MKLVILAAGKGSRFLPLTKEIPKGLILINEKPLLEHVLKPYLPHVSDIIFIINDELGHKIEKHFGNSYQGHNMQYIVQTESNPKGTLSALLLAKEHLLEEKLFCVSNCDDLLKEIDISQAIQKQKPGIGITTSTMPWNYLSIETEPQMNVTGFKRHKREDSDLINGNFSNGFYILSPKVFEFTPIQMRDGEFGLPQTLFENLNKQPLDGFMFEKWQSVNGPNDIVDAEKFLNHD